ncbi:hypothetical protein SAMN05443245_4678 [Paraburkholderia fungorum]|uniref:Uncharacterized protein n=1 Tax=Paraburkholderia fungorum TaxID=134537 RepID=A0A1H1I624_9BURK|nr:hypothetical protein [Paraburkholderia fungorum]SDR32808.1 hypothetical protein SAMN05443245_4678 [Paraburkholderia fungorum]
MRFEWTKNSGRSELIEGIPDREFPIAVRGYGGMLPTLRGGTTRKVFVSFQNLDEPDTPPFHEEVSFSHLRALRVGTVWQKRRYVGEVQYQELGPTEVNFTRGEWRLISPITEVQAGRPAPFNGQYRASRQSEDKERSWMLEFGLPGNRTLLVPCLEFLLRCYGISEAIPRALCSMPWSDAMKQFLTSLTPEVNAEDKLIIRLTERAQDGDRNFLAHVLHTELGRQVTQDISEQCLMEGKNEDLIFPRVQPWFEGKLPVAAQGVWVRPGQTFLALRIELRGHPKCKGIVCYKTRKNEVVRRSDDQTDEHAREGSRSYALSPEANLKVHVPGVEHSYGNLHVESRERRGVHFPFGPEPDITNIFESKPSVIVPPGGVDAPGININGQDATDAPVAHRIVVADGTLLEMWRALQVLKTQHSKHIHSLKWLHATRGFVDDETPELIALREFKEHDQVKPEIRNWVTRNAKTETPRGVLVLRIVASVPKTKERRTVYVLEIERRLKRSKVGKKTISEEADSYRGLSAVLAPATDFDDWLQKTLSMIRQLAGHVVELESTHPDLIEAFKHSQSKSETTTPFRSAALLALKKGGVEL